MLGRSWIGGAGSSGSPTIPSNVWMAAPDILAFTIDDPPIITGNLENGSFSGNAYGTWFQRTNPSGGPNEWCAPIGPTRSQVRYSDKPPATAYKNKVALRTLANYTVTGATATAVYYRDEANGQGDSIAQSNGQATARMITQQHTVYIKLSAAPANNTVITVSNNQANTFTQFNFTYNDKTIRAGGIQVNQVGQRPDDNLRYGYLAVRIPGGPNQGTVDFINTYSKTSFQVLDSNKNSVYTGSIVQRCSSAAAAGEGFDSGIDVADLAHGFTVTGISKASSAVVTCPGHDFVNGDKVRLAGINGMTQIDDPSLIPPGGAGTWVAPTVTATTATTATINIDSTGFSTFVAGTDFSTALGGINNKIFKCFNTNRAGTYVFGLDFSGWTPGTSGTHYIYIPGYGISDPFLIRSDAWAVAAGKTHQGIFNMRLGCAVSSDSGYSRGVALSDGVSGCTNYKSNLPALFSSECAESYAPSGSSTIGAGMGAYVNAGTLTLTDLRSASGTATATTSAPHGVGIGQTFAVQIIGADALFNYVLGSSTGGPALATGASTFTYDVSQTVGAGTVVSSTPGTARTGFVTSTRTGTKAAVQDAGDNDDVAIDHIPGYKLLALVFRNIPQASRFTPYTVPLSTTLLDASLYAGTNSLPPLFHELFWYADQFRVGQEVSGAIWGGYGLGKFSSQVPDYPETIDKYHGTDAGGSLTGQTVMGFAYAPDHYTAFLYAGLAAQLAQIAYDYSLTTLGDTWKASAIAAYSWANGIATSVTTRDTYYITSLNLKVKAGWTTTQYNDAMNTLNSRAVVAKVDAAGSLYRLLGTSSGAAYGDFIEKKTLVFPSVAAGGTGYAVNDEIVAAGGTGVDFPLRLLVTGVSGGVVTSVVAIHTGQYTTTPSSPVSQASTTGSGSGATFNVTAVNNWNLYYDRNCIGIYDYCQTSGVNASNKTFMTTPANYANNNPTLGLNSAMGYMGMLFDAATTSSRVNFMGLAAPIKAIQAHLMYVATNGVVAGAYSLNYIKLMQAGGSFQLGANLPNKAFQVGTGPRPVVAVLHEDSFKAGSAPPYGLIPYSYFAYATSFMFFNFVGIGNAGGDNQSAYNSDNVSGSYEGFATPGSAKMWNPWRFGSAFWEWAPQNRTIIYNSEYDLTGSQLNTLAVQLYLHGWDGNT
jgi:hypothetical protein